MASPNFQTWWGTIIKKMTKALTLRFERRASWLLTTPPNKCLSTCDANSTNTASSPKEKKKASISSSHRQAKQAPKRSRIRGAIFSALIAWIHGCDFSCDIHNIPLLFSIKSFAQHILISKLTELYNINHDRRPKNPLREGSRLEWYASSTLHSRKT